MKCALIPRILFVYLLCTGAPASANPLSSNTDTILSTLEGSEKGSYPLVSFDSGTEAYVQSVQTLRDGSKLFALRLLQGQYQGALVWTREAASDPKLTLYHTEHGISIQTLDAESANFIHANSKFSAAVDLETVIKGVAGINAEPELNCAKQLVDLSAFYPIGKQVPAIKSTTSANEKAEACPVRPKTSKGQSCPKTRPIDLSHAAKLRSYIKEAATRMNVDPALMKALLAQESQFDPFAENLTERKTCESGKKKTECSEYGWGKSMAQMGTVLAVRYGLDWQAKVPKPSGACAVQRTSDACMEMLEKFCAQKMKENGKYPLFCPRQSILALASYLREMVNREHNIQVLVPTEKGTKVERVIDLRLVMGHDENDMLRYLAGEYNRGPRVENSIEEYFRQKGKAPEFYGNAWAAPRRVNTPSLNMGFQVLNGEYVNRCYVWNVGGLCGTSVPKDSLLGYYRRASE